MLPAFDWALFNNRKIKMFTIVDLAESLPFLFSCFILVWGFKRLIRNMQSTKKDFLVDKAIIIWHIIAYFFVVIATLIQEYVYFKYPKSYEISTYCLLVIVLACSTILAVIVNTILTRYLQTKPSSEDSFESERTASIASQQNEF